MTGAAKPSIKRVVSTIVKKKLHKKKRKSKNSANGFAQNIAPVCGLFVFVGLVGYRNYLLSMHDSEVVMLHHFRRQLPEEMPERIETPEIPARLRGMYEMKIKNGLAADTMNSDDTNADLQKYKYLTNAKITKKSPGLAKIEIYSPSEKDKKLAKMQMKRRYEDRKKLLLEKCGNNQTNTWNETMQLIAVPERNFTVCVVQKAGSTSWHKLVYKLRMNGNPWEKAGHTLNKIAADELPQRTKHHLMRSRFVTRIITVRHPFSRLISGWHNKFHKDFPMRDVFLTKVGDYAGRHIPEKDHVLAFQDLAQYLADNGLDDVDVHFKSIEQLCSPCQFPYSHIVRAETVLEDLWYVLDRVNTTMEGFNKHSVTAKSQESDEKPPERELTPWEKERDTIKQFFENIPKETTAKLMSLYRDDFEKFGYTYDLDTHVIGDIID
uniref:carbohydrate sulfotransferase 11-like n=1 Tax=Styela clava TaxID=7725 RepID=UPI001939CB7B|nr:carbohydrate sulfotransferase 11-like [Styela clava]